MNPSILITPNSGEAGKLFSIVPTNGTGDLDVVRNTTATYVGADGLIQTALANVPRLDYTNGSCPSILVEPQRTNLLLYSEEFQSLYWGKNSGTITANDAIAPNGTMTADLFTKISGVNTVSSVSRVSAYSTTGIHTMSVYIKPKVGNIVLLRLDSSGNSANTVFNFTTKTFTNIGVNFISSSYEELPDGWFRLKLTGNVLLATWNLDVCNFFTNPTGDAMWIWGAQLEVGSNATSYIPTTTATVTRNADVISKSGISDLIGQTEGTIYISLNVSNLTGLRYIFTIIGSNGYTRIRKNNSALQAETFISGVFVAQPTGGTFNLGLNKLAVSYKNGEVISLFINGVNSANSGIISANVLGSEIRLGTDNFLIDYLSDSINSVNVFKTRLTNLELQQLTTL